MMGKAREIGDAFGVSMERQVQQLNPRNNYSDPRLLVLSVDFKLSGTFLKSFFFFENLVFVSRALLDARLFACSYWLIKTLARA